MARFFLERVFTAAPRKAARDPTRNSHRDAVFERNDLLGRLSRPLDPESIEWVKL